MKIIRNFIILTLFLSLFNILVTNATKHNIKNSDKIIKNNTQIFKEKNPKLNKTIIMSNFNQNRIKGFDYTYFLKDIGDNGFICIILLYFQSSPLLLFLFSQLIKLFLIYINLATKTTIFDIVPQEYFQIFAFVFYNLAGISILCSLMIGDLNKRNENNNEIFSKERRGIDYKFKISNSFKLFQDFETLNNILTIGIVIISQIKYTSIPFALYSESILSIINNNFLYQFGIELISNLISVSIALLIGHILYKKISLETNLFAVSISFLILGIGIAVRFFSNLK